MWINFLTIKKPAFTSTLGPSLSCNNHFFWRRSNAHTGVSKSTEYPAQLFARFLLEVKRTPGEIYVTPFARTLLN